MGLAMLGRVELFSHPGLRERSPGLMNTSH